MIVDTLKTDLKLAMKFQDAVMKSCIQVVLANIQNASIAAKEELSDDEVLKIIQKEIKQLGEVIQQTPVDDPRKEQATVQKAYLTRFLPAQLSKKEVNKEVDRILSAMDNPNKGEAMKAVMFVLKGKADGRDISDAVDFYLKSK